MVGARGEGRLRRLSMVAPAARMQLPRELVGCRTLKTREATCLKALAFLPLPSYTCTEADPSLAELGAGKSARPS